MSTNTVPNAYCVIAGMPGATPLTIIGSFDTHEEALDHQAKHQKENPDVLVTVDILLNPANC